MIQLYIGENLCSLLDSGDWSVPTDAELQVALNSDHQRIMRTLGTEIPDRPAVSAREIAELWKAEVVSLKGNLKPDVADPLAVH